MITRFSPGFCGRLREALTRVGFDADGVLAVLGGSAHAALGRSEQEPARRASRDAGELGTLIRLFLCADAEPLSPVASALTPVGLDEAVTAGLLRVGDGTVSAALDLRSYADETGSWWVLSDLDPEVSRVRGGATDPGHVLGVGHASLSLARATLRRPVGTLLDLGTGCGVQTLHASRHARRVTATDVSPRALALARANFLLNDLGVTDGDLGVADGAGGHGVEVLAGSWFEPVAGRRFDQIVCNPPFVVGPARVDHVYRDSGLAGDGASELMIRELPGHLNPGGVGQLLAAWTHVRGQDWVERVSAWVPPGTDAWIAQRDVADPALYVGTWLRDSGLDPRSPLGRERAARWLDFLADNDVEGVGFGFVTLRRTDADGHVSCEDLRQAFDDPLGPETGAWLDRIDWLRDNGDDESLLDTVFRVPDTVVLENIARPGDEGWEVFVRRLHRTDGPGWRHDTDEIASALLAGCRGALPLRDLISLLSHAHGVPAGILAPVTVAAVRGLIQHGMVEPVGGR